MPFEIAFTRTAADQIRAYRIFEQTLIFDAIEDQSRHEPTTETRNRKRLGPNELSDWERRIQRFRVFFDVIADADVPTVKIKAVGHEEHSTLFIGGKEFQ